LARQLNMQLLPHTDWRWQYVHQVIKGRLVASTKLRLAIFRLHEKIFDGPQPTLRRVSILAPIGFVPSRTLVMTRARTCALRTCQRSFVPSNPSQRFHSPACRQRSRQSKRSKRRHKYHTQLAFVLRSISSRRRIKNQKRLIVLNRSVNLDQHERSL